MKTLGNLVKTLKVLGELMLGQYFLPSSKWWILTWVPSLLVTYSLVFMNLLRPSASVMKPFSTQSSRIVVLKSVHLRKLLHS